MKPVRVAFWSGVFPPSYETFVFNQVRGLVRHGFDVEVIAQKRGSQQSILSDSELAYFQDRSWYRPSIPRTKLRRVTKAIGLGLVYGFRSPRAVCRALGRPKEATQLGTFGRLYHLVPFLTTKKFDIIHCQYGPLGNVAVELRNRGLIDGKIVTTFRGFDLSTVIQDNPDAYKHLFRDGDLMLPNNEDFAERLVAMGCEPRKIVVQREGIDCSLFPPKSQLRGHNNAVHLITVSRLTEKKGIEYVLEAIGRLGSDTPRIRYQIVGDGPLRHKLEGAAAKLPGNVEVSFSGWLKPTEVANALRSSDVLIQASVKAASGNEEGIPNVLKEGMATGLPVIATFHAGIPELVEDGVSGYLVPERDVSALADRLARLIGQPEKWIEMGEKGRERVEAEYDMERLNRQLSSIYERLLGRSCQAV